MELKDALKRLEKSDEFKNWYKKNPDNFFSYAFTLLEDKKENPWQLGYYHESTNKVVTFTVNDDSIETEKEEEVFKKPDMKVKKVDIEKVKIPFKDILKIIEEFRKKEYSKELVNKTMVILQNLGSHGIIWNITYVTHAFNTLNIKVNAESGKIMKHSLDSIMSFVKK
ncbi:hypothetical protein CL615_03045 [archaeon]|jgi:hypothetical protein|nr:hypothetical protein [archaeon]MDP6548297.1 hypothetical protein [Candidatus Woesearchaeota archaeon]|tara:strand:+ start:10380 stop:10883 length:504 start_codon:yes stop_codon:yes gene_type:complete